MFHKGISIIALVSFLLWSTWYVYTNAEDFAPLTQVYWFDVVMLILAFLLILTCNGLFILVVTSAFHIQLRKVEWLSLSFASSFANYFLPFRGGAGLRAMYMSKLHGFPISEFISTLSVMYLMHIVVNGLLALAGMGLIALNDGPVNITLFIFFLLLALAGILAMTFDIEISAAHKRFPMAQLHKLFWGWKKVRQDKILLAKLWALMLTLTIATVWQCGVAFNAVSIPLSWGGVLVYAASKNLATLVSLTPGSLGVVEIISIYLGSVLGYNTSNALLVQGLIRSVAIIVLSMSGPFALLFLQRHIKSSRQEPGKQNKQ